MTTLFYFSVITGKKLSLITAASPHKGAKYMTVLSSECFFTNFSLSTKKNIFGKHQLTRVKLI